MKFKLCILIGCLILLGIVGLFVADLVPGFPFGSTLGATPESMPDLIPDENTIQDIQFSGADFAAGSGNGLIVADNNLMMADGVDTAVYTSDIITSPIPFNAIVPQWIANIPDMTSLEISLRTKTAVGDWSQWYPVHENLDWTLPDDPDTVGGMIAVPAADVTHQHLQFAVSFSRDEDAAPTLNQLTLTVIDTSGGPTTEAMLSQQAMLDINRPDNQQAIADGFPRPTVISREVWCTHEDCDYSGGLDYSPATNIVVHHTVTANDKSDWAATVRAIWRFHTYTRGWGDIGYNYLVDRDGVIYEGHMNQDYWNLDVVSTHAGNANKGSLGVSLIGTFTSPDEYPISDTPPPIMQAALADLLAWKADQRNIDVYDAHRLPNLSWGLPTLMGHRDVYGGTATTCPGGNAYDLLPSFRDQVAQRINFVSPYIYIDELSSAFTKSNNNWHEGPRGCGNNGHSYFTWNVNDPDLSENWGEWRPNVPTDGFYEIQVYAPYCDTDASETDGAIYTISHVNGTDTVTISHEDDVGLWMSLGIFELQAGTNNLIRLTDLTSGDPTNYDYAVWFDGLRLKSSVQLPDVTVQNSAPASGNWSTQTSVNFNWSINHPVLVLDSTLQVATDPAFNHIIYQTTVPDGQNSVSHDFGQEYPALYWRVLVKTIALETIVSAATQFGIDTGPPVSAVNGVYELPQGYYVVSWDGNDAASGIASYTVDYRAQGDTNWIQLSSGTAATAVNFTPPNPNQIYEFRSQATDHVGHVEALHAAPDMNTTQSIYLTHSMILPIIYR